MSFPIHHQHNRSSHGKKIIPALRDTCEQNDGMQGYGWTFYDTRVGGSQIAHDTQLQIDLETAFLKTEGEDSWAVQVTGTPKSDSVKTSLIFHIAVEKADDANGPKTLVCASQGEGGEGVEASCEGEIAGLGKFEFRVVGDVKNKAVHNTAVKAVQVSEDKIWQAKCKFLDARFLLGWSTLTDQLCDSRVCRPGQGRRRRNRRECGSGEQAWCWEYALYPAHLPRSIHCNLYISRGGSDRSGW